MIVELMIGLLVQAAVPDDLPEEETTFSERQPVRLAPLPAARAFATFRDTCMATFPDPVALGEAVDGTGLGFVAVAEAQRGASEWSSRHGQIVLRPTVDRERDERRERREGRTPRERWDARCDLWVAIEERMEPDALIAAIGAALARGSRAEEQILGASWDLPRPEGGATLRLYYVPSIDEPRLFTLSLQRFGAGTPQ